MRGRLSLELATACITFLLGGLRLLDTWVGKTFPDRWLNGKVHGYRAKDT